MSIAACRRNLARLVAFAAIGLAFTGFGSADAGPVFAKYETSQASASRGGETVTSVTRQEPVQQASNGGESGSLAGPERRVALVIGNSAYENVTRLPNPTNDAKAIGQFLNSAGFEVIQATDLEHDEMIQVLQDFSAKVAERGPNTVAFVYYAGHGLQIAGDNYLVPVDAKISSEADVAGSAIRLVDVMATLQAVPSRMRIVVLDACRNNPFSQLKDAGRGLAIVDAPTGSIVAYSTAPGTEAFDGDGSNSPYTAAFLRLAREPNVPIEQFFKKVRVIVNDVTDGKQTPWESSSLTSDFYFVGDTAVAASHSIDPALRANAAATRPTTVASNIRSRTPREAFNYAVAEDSVEHYQEFVRVYPNEPLADRIRRLLSAKLMAAAWHGAVLENSPGAYRKFYGQYPDSAYASLAMKLEAQPKPAPLYQPTKIIVAPKITHQIKLSNFNGVAVPQGSSAPLGLGIGQGSLLKGAKTLLNPQGQDASSPIAKTFPMATRPGVANEPFRSGAPGIDLAKGVKRIDTKMDANRVTTLATPNSQGSGSGSRLLDVKRARPDGETGFGGRIQSRSEINGQPHGRPLVKRPGASQAIGLPPRSAHVNTSHEDRSMTGKRFRLGERNQGNGTRLFGNSQARNSKPMSFNSNGGQGKRFAGGLGFGRSFR